MLLADQILKELRLTEKSTVLSSENNQYTFEVFKQANRDEIAKAVEKTFGVTVEKVNTLTIKGKLKRSRTQRGKMGRRANLKKAIVTLKKGDTIDML